MKNSTTDSGDTAGEWGVEMTNLDVVGAKLVSYHTE